MFYEASIAAASGNDVKAIDVHQGMVDKKSQKEYAGSIISRWNLWEDGANFAHWIQELALCDISRDAVWTLYDRKKAFRRWKAVIKNQVEGSFILDGDYRTIEPTLKI